MINFFEKITSRQKKVLKFGLLAVILFSVIGSVAVFGKVSLSPNYFSGLKSVFFETFRETFGLAKEAPAYEIDLAFSNKESPKEDDERTAGNSSGLSIKTKSKSGTANILNTADDGAAKSNSNEVDLQDKKETADQKEVSQEKKPVSDEPEEVSSCSFYAGNLPSKKVLFSEIAWMGNDFSANDEWIELFNNSSKSVNLNGWRILNENGKIEIVFDTGNIPEKSFYTLERTDDNSIPSSPADKIYAGALANGGEWLRLFDAKCELVDEVDAKGGWEILGGDNNSKRTLERNLENFNWQTSLNSNGTPKKSNSSGLAVAPNSQNGNSSPAPSSTSGDSEANSEPLDQAQGEPDPDPDPDPPPADTSIEPADETSKTIFVTEIMAGSSVSSGDEFVELYNYGSSSVDLTGWTIKKKTSSGAESALLVASRLEGKVIPAGKYLLLAHDGGYAGSVAADVLWPASYSLAYTNNAVTIYDASGVLVEEVNWVEIPKDKSYARSSMDISAGFGVADSPSPQSSSN